MITADVLKTLISFSTGALNRAVGNEEKGFLRSEFVGITNGGQFAYSATYLEDGKERNTKVFLNYNHAEGSVSVDY